MVTWLKKKNYNLSIHKLKKDKCEKCERYKNITNKIAAQEAEYAAHIKLKDELKVTFLEEQTNAKIDPSLLVASFDLQMVLNRLRWTILDSPP